MKGVVDGGLHFREAARSAFGACDVTYDAIGVRCGLTRQTVWYALNGKCRMRHGAAKAIKTALTDVINAEIASELGRIDMLNKLINDLDSSYNRDYAGEGERNE